ncbi:MAG: hypothetical protein NT027_09085 [Proteobacteria bacterium]|nr:hypothetical protein [Pseudomonadota bacterium]
MFARFFHVIVGFLHCANSFGATYDFSYSGRLVDSTGRPLEGPVALRASFFHSETGTTSILDVTTGCNDNDTGSATSAAFVIPQGADHLSFIMAGGADSPSGVYVKSVSDNSVLCSSTTGTNTDTFFSDLCTGLSAYVGTPAYICVG